MTKNGDRTSYRHTPLLLLMAIFAALVILYGRTLGPFEGPDEEEHFAYVTYLMNEKRLPDWETDFEPAIHQEVSQAPLYYVTAALWGQLIPLETWTGNPVRNPWWPGVGVGAIPTTNHNHYLMKEDQHILNENLFAMSHAVEWLRLTSIGFGFITLAGMYWAGLALWQDRRWSLLAVIFMALTPELLQVFSTISNDTAVIAFSTVTIAASLHLYRQPTIRYRLGAGIGLAMGLAALSKTSGLALWPLPFVVLLLRSGEFTRRQLTTMAGLILVTALLVSGWWYIRGWLLFDDPLGTGPHELMSWGRQGNPLTFSELRDYVKTFWPHLWALFGWGFVKPSLWGFLPPLAALVMSAVGWRQWMIRRQQMDWRPFILLVLVTLIGLSSIVYWLMNVSIVPPRLFYPFYSAVILLVVHGLTRFPKLRLWWAALFGSLALIIIPTTLHPTYGLPALFDTPPNDLQGQQIDFDGATLLGYNFQVQDESRHIYEISLCWMAPAEQPYLMVHPFALSILNSEQESVADLISHTGGGRYTAWQPGKGFCDPYTIALPPDPAQAYLVMVNLYDLNTDQMLFGNELDGTPRESGFIGMIGFSGERVSRDELEHARFSFDDTVHLLDTSIEQDEDALNFIFMWGTSRSNQYSHVQQFIHVFDQDNQKVAQLDFAPSTNGYTIPLWGANERITDQVSLPIGDLPPGDYRILSGLYFVENLQRLPAVDADGIPLQDNIIPLGTFTIDGDQ